MRTLNYLGFILSTLFIISCQDEDQGQQAQGPAPYPVIEIPQRTVTGYTSYPVSLEGTTNSAVRAKVPGYITEVLVDAGEKVRNGQTLFRLETEALTQDAGAARANVNAAMVEVNKLEPLVEKNIISPVQLETAKARLEQAKANYSSIAANIGYASIKSPVDGSVGSINFREGALVSPGDPTPLTTVTNTEEVYAFFSMNERDYLNFIQTTEGTTISEKLENMPDVELQLVNGNIYDQPGKIQTVTNQVDRSTGSVTFRAEFPNPTGILASGNSGNIRIPRTFEDAVVVPAASTFEQQGTVHVYRVVGDSVALSTVIKVQDRIENLIIVASGIEAGDKIVARGVGQLRNDTPVQPQMVSFDSIVNSLQPVFK